MFPEEFDEWQTEFAAAYAQEQVSAGAWTAEEALTRARESNASLLPRGLATPGMIILTGVLADDTPIGRLWISLTHPRGVRHCAFLYLIEVAEEHRGRGLGRALLAAAEAAAREHGARALELNVFASNTSAISLYRTAGYQVTTQRMRRDLTGVTGKR
jgi:ribosomal protein S18 acetylase RimI-like enzyme